MEGGGGTSTEIIKQAKEHTPSNQEQPGMTSQEFEKNKNRVRLEYLYVRVIEDELAGCRVIFRDKRWARQDMPVCRKKATYFEEKCLRIAEFWIFQGVLRLQISCKSFYRRSKLSALSRAIPMGCLFRVTLCTPVV
ncbi:hypothetical protein PILCRDRAFT_84846 [Piloderma croceum F 1598]|uniref:Uncharacterized protein n=1 Tax=Piloderma croceum (strain F 1598) TaxID=765440 RepID=A0A0C3BRC1_PILCF|nr:hypothetical protein PILCRDRAFT_84846 [Piloderma croceum F 1598]